jgi:hypothetical protein
VWRKKVKTYIVTYDGALLWTGEAKNADAALDLHAHDIGYGTFRDLALLAEPPYDPDTTTEADYIAAVRTRYAVSARDAL